MKMFFLNIRCNKGMIIYSVAVGLIKRNEHYYGLIILVILF